jgi:hypothetical protein
MFQEIKMSNKRVKKTSASKAKRHAVNGAFGQTLSEFKRTARPCYAKQARGW